MPSNGLAFRSNGLLMPGLMWEPGASEIKSALETVIVADVEDWWNQKFWADILPGKARDKTAKNVTKTV